MPTAPARGQRQIEGKLFRTLVRAYTPRMRAVRANVLRDLPNTALERHAAIQPLRAGERQLARVLGDYREDAARYGRNRVGRLMGHNPTGRWVQDPIAEHTERHGAEDSARLYTSRLLREIDSIVFYELEAGYPGGEFTEPWWGALEGKLTAAADHELRRLARTEATFGESAGAYHALETYGSYGKRWITAADEDVRHSHASLHGVSLPMYDLFDNDLRFPGDVMRGTPRGWMSCRCIIVPATFDDVWPAYVEEELHRTEQTARR